LKEASKILDSSKIRAIHVDIGSATSEIEILEARKEAINRTALRVLAMPIGRYVIRANRGNKKNFKLTNFNWGYRGSLTLSSHPITPTDVVRLPEMKLAAIVPPNRAPSRSEVRNNLPVEIQEFFLMKQCDFSIRINQ
jgi:hypothetical protein